MVIEAAKRLSVLHESSPKKENTDERGWSSWMMTLRWKIELQKSWERLGTNWRRIFVDQAEDWPILCIDQPSRFLRLFDVWACNWIHSCGIDDLRRWECVIEKSVKAMLCMSCRDNVQVLGYVRFPEGWYDYWMKLHAGILEEQYFSFLKTLV